MPSTPVKVLVIVPERTFTRDDGSTDTEPGIRAARRFWPNGETEAVLEDEPPDTFDFVEPVTGAKHTEDRNKNYTVGWKLKDLEWHKGGKEIIIPDGNKVRKITTPMLLTYRVLGEVKPEKQARAG